MILRAPLLKTKNGIINKHTKKAGKISLRDYERCIAELLKMISVQLKETQQNDLEEAI